MTESEKCDGKRKKKSKSAKSSDREASCQEDGQDRTLKTKKKKPSTQPEETLGSAPVVKAKKRPSQSEVAEVKKKKKSKEEQEHKEEQTEKKPKKMKKTKKSSCKTEEPQQEAPASAGEDQREEDEDEEEALGPEERRTLERRLKKLRKQEAKSRLKAEGKEAEGDETAKPDKPSAAQLALDYLTCWAEKRTDWRFQKTRQTWLLQHMFDREKVPDESFSALLPYLEGLRGVARDTTVEKAEALMRQLEEKEAEEEEEEGAEEKEEAPLRAARAREVIQMLS